MTRLYRPPRRDANEGDIIDGLVRVGAIVYKLDQKDIPDLLVGYRGRWILLEVKLPLGPKGGAVSHQTLSDGQADFFAAAVRHSLPVFLVRSVEESYQAIGANESILEGLA